ncbi:hypothetical protein G9A89_014880 [Geosiphon pyriformis]|nr:hypothetical protein G9A89_014880 [Geosiphon pyriformis]
MFAGTSSGIYWNWNVTGPDWMDVADESTDEPTNELNEYRMDNEPSSIITPDDWENQLRDWEQMLIDEEIARLEDEKAERDNNGNMEGDLRNRKHPDGTLPLPSPIPLPIIGNLHQIGFPFHLGFTKLAHQYGSIYEVRVGAERWIVVNDHEIGKELFLNRGVVYASRPDSYLFNRIVMRGSKSVALAPYSDWWKIMRMFEANAFRQSVIDTTYHPIIHKQMKIFLKGIHNFSESPFNPVDQISHCIMSIFMTIIYGPSIVTTPENRPAFLLYEKAIQQVFDFIEAKGHSFEIFPWLRYIPIIGNGLENQAKKTRKDLDESFDMMIAQIEKDLDRDGVESNQSIVGHLLTTVKVDQNLVADPFTHKFIKDKEGSYVFDRFDINTISNDIIIAGTHSTIGSIKWLFALLATYPEVQRKIQTELDHVVGKGNFMKIEQESELHYLKATVKESLRPVTFFSLPHQVMKDDNYCGYLIKAGSIVVLNIHGIHMNPKLHENPDQFNPDRYLDENGKLRNFDYAYDPWNFSRGRRRCPGSEMALRDIQIITAYTLAFFSFEPELDLRTGRPKAIDLTGHGHSLNFLPHDYNLKFLLRDGVNYEKQLF